MFPIRSPRRSFRFHRVPARSVGPQESSWDKQWIACMADPRFRQALALLVFLSWPFVYSLFFVTVDPLLLCLWFLPIAAATASCEAADRSPDCAHYETGLARCGPVDSRASVVAPGFSPVAVGLAQRYLGIQRDSSPTFCVAPRADSAARFAAMAKARSLAAPAHGFDAPASCL